MVIFTLSYLTEVSILMFYQQQLYWKFQVQSYIALLGHLVLVGEFKLNFHGGFTFKSGSITAYLTEWQKWQLCLMLSQCKLISSNFDESFEFVINWFQN